MHSNKMAFQEPPVEQVPEDEKPGSYALPPYQPPEVAHLPPQPYYPQWQGTYLPPIAAQPTTFQSTSTTVVVTQPSTMVVQQQKLRPWSSGLCGCFEDCGICFAGFCCGEHLLCGISSRMGEGFCLPYLCAMNMVLAGLRIKLRTQENIQGSILDDYLCSTCCTSLVLCQMARELNHIGK